MTLGNCLKISQTMDSLTMHDNVVNKITTFRIFLVKYCISYLKFSVFLYCQYRRMNNFLAVLVIGVALSIDSIECQIIDYCNAKLCYSGTHSACHITGVSSLF